MTADSGNCLEFLFQLTTLSKENITIEVRVVTQPAKKVQKQDRRPRSSSPVGYEKHIS
jgi:hypothetical protein